MEEHEPVSFGTWVKKRRKALDLTQDELARRASCSIFALRKIESGERRPSKQLAGWLATALEMSEADKPTFIRVARGDLNLGRLPSPSTGSTPISPPLQTDLHHLPLPPTPLLGRDPELAAIERIFNESGCRLLTLTGMGGIGKTRLGIEFALRKCSMFPAGVHYIPLASINSAELIVSVMAQVLGFSFSGPLDPKGQFFNYLAQQIRTPALLVLDNLEHLIVQSSIAAELIAEILMGFSNIKIICTSRERLNIHGEWIYELHGLHIPPSEFVERLEDYGAADLFIQNARRVNHEFELSDSGRPALVQICQLLEGIPLAIELAAVWANMLTCQEIAQEIEANIDFLSTSLRDIPERHRSMRATFDHSWNLLSAVEKNTLCRLAVFHGGFTRKAAEQIAGTTLSLLSSLVTKSLVRCIESGRYELHEVIRQYAFSHLKDDRSLYLETRDRHSEFYLKLVAEHEQDLKSAAQQAVMRELSRDMDNIRIAWEWGIQRKNFPLLALPIRSLSWIYEVGGLTTEGIEQLDLLVQALKAQTLDNQHAGVLGIVLAQQGLLYFRKGEYLCSQQLYQESISILRQTGDQALLADALIFLGVIRHLQGDYQQSKSLLQEGLACALAVNDEWFAAYAIYNLGGIDFFIGDYLKGYQESLQGLKIWRSLGDPHSIALGLNFLTPILIKLGLYEEARASVQESIKLCQQTKNRWGLGTAYRHLGLVEMAQGHPREAQLHLTRSLEKFGDYIVGWDIARSQIYLGAATRMAGDLAGARTILVDALRLSHEINSLPLVLDAVIELACLEVHSNPRQAISWLISVVDHPALAHEALERAHQLMLEARNHLDRELTSTTTADLPTQSLDTIVHKLISGRVAV
jgi:predicted ATPase/transcriptional regulator with XRE-family HTH domain